MQITHTPPDRDGDSHLHPLAYGALALLAGTIGLSASYVTVQLFAVAIQASEAEGMGRELLTLAAVLFVAAELAACFIAGLVPVRRLRSLRWQLITCAVFLVGFEAVSLYGARVVLVQAAEAQAGASQGRAQALRARIEASRRTAAALLAAGEVSSRSVLPSSRAEGARAIREAAGMEADTARLAAELAQVEAARVPTQADVFGQTGVVALAVAQSLLISGIGLLFLGAAGALARAARDARATAMQRRFSERASTDASQSATDALADAMAVATAARIPAPTDASPLEPVAVPQAQAAPKGVPAAVVPSWGRYAALAAGAGLLVPYAAQAAAVPTQAKATDAAPTQPEAPAAAIHATVAPTDARADAAMPMQAHVDASTDVSDALADACTDGTPAPTDASPCTAASTAPAIHAAAAQPVQLDAFPEALILTATDATPTAARNDDGARFLRVKAGIEAGRIKPTLRAIYAAEGASQEVARRYLVELDRAGVLIREGRGYRLSAV